MFVPHDFSPNPIFLAIVHGKPAVVPCKVTDPKAKVSFITMTGREVELDDSFTYSPKKGFQIFYPDVYFGNTFNCKADTEQNTETILVVMRYLRKCTAESLLFQICWGDFG